MLLNENNAAFHRARIGRYALRKAHANEHLRKELWRIPHDNPTECMATLVEDVKAGEYEVLQMLHNGKQVGHIIYKVEQGDHGSEFLIVAATATDPTAQLTENILPLIEDLARRMNCRTMRLHTMRLGLVAKAMEQGWHTSEIVLRKELGDGPQK